MSRIRDGQRVLYRDYIMALSKSSYKINVLLADDIERSSCGVMLGPVWANSVSGVLL